VPAVAKYGDGPTGSRASLFVSGSVEAGIIANLGSVFGGAVFATGFGGGGAMTVSGRLVTTAGCLCPVNMSQRLVGREESSPSPEVVAGAGGATWTVIVGSVAWTAQA
jgi:hypothetical protein